jgi:hypothetical protein
MFKTRSQLTSGEIYFKRRSVVTDEQCQRLGASVQELLQAVSWDRIINCDETFWLLHLNDILTWAEVEMESVQATNENNEQESFMIAAAAITTADKLPLEFIASGKTIRVERTQIGQVDGHWRDHSQNGWRTSETLRNYGMTLQCKLGPGPIHSLLDLYSGHRTDQVKATTATLGATLHDIPPGLTDKFQPLDRSVLGVLKAQGKRGFHARFYAKPNDRHTNHEAVEM